LRRFVIFFAAEKLNSLRKIEALVQTQNPAAQLMWCVGGISLLVWAFAMTHLSRDFALGIALSTLPIIAVVVLMCGGGFIFLAATVLLLRREITFDDSPKLIAWIFVIGLAARVVLLASESILEVDFNRYLWDGGMVAAGFDPYAIAPADIIRLPYNDLRLELSKTAAGVFDRIHYPMLTTIYPPIAQAAFALAHVLDPWSLTAWRIVCIAGETLTFMVMVSLLGVLNRKRSLVALYWWCPLVLKETVNSAHMEAVLTPLVLCAVHAAIAGRTWRAWGALALAIGTKLWPIVLVPLIARATLHHLSPGLRCIVGISFVGAVALMLSPMLTNGFTRGAGLGAFATTWSTNSAHMVVLESILPSLAARLLCAALLLAFVIWIAAHASREPVDLMRRIAVTAGAVVLLSPAQFPWYVLWVLPLAVCDRGTTWLVAAALLPLYYLAFHLDRAGLMWWHHGAIVWLIWFPVWATLLWTDATPHRKPRAA
jgi:alpha-1,6-mannosyltransferase